MSANVAPLLRQPSPKWIPLRHRSGVYHETTAEAAASVLVKHISLIRASRLMALKLHLSSFTDGNLS
ncbi:MAG: hypothetical protein ACTS80_00975 [Candidatus Hodgkinia cicadicola]